MVRGSAKQQVDESTGTKNDQTSDVPTVGPPLLILGLGFASVLVSLPLVFASGVVLHILGYVTGGLVPILVIGLARRIDLDRRRSPHYRPVGLLRPALGTLAVLAVAAALLHIWPLATELAS
ncbi:MAG: hypothetical protein ABI239_09215 [Aquihabitans sp.]